MTLATWEAIVRLLGGSLLVGAWLYSSFGAARGSQRPAALAVGLAGRMRAHTVYLITAVPYFALCVLLWKPLPTPSEPWRAVMLLLGSLLGFTGAGFYYLGRRELGAMYNVSSSLGSELYEGHVLVTTGPYTLCRHPMYLGLFLAAAGGLMVYRTWTLVFMCLTLAGAVVKAGKEEALLARRFGGAWFRYASEVPPWIPRLKKRTEEVADVYAPEASR